MRGLARAAALLPASAAAVVLAGSCFSCAGVPLVRPSDADPIVVSYVAACRTLDRWAKDACDWDVVYDQTENPFQIAVIEHQKRPPTITITDGFLSVHERYGYWAGVFIMAHEIGHGIDARMGIMFLMSRHQMELSADEWGGCAIQLLGGDLSQAEDAAKGIFDETPSHPSSTERIKAMRRGAKRCASLAP